MTWKKWRAQRTLDRATELGVDMTEVRVGPIRLTWWYYRWLARILPDTALYQFLRMLEVPAIIVALVAFWIDYADRPIDRATRNAQLLAQVAQLATIEHANASGGIKAILEFLTDEDVSMRGISLEQIKLREVDLEGAQLTGANLRRARLSGAQLTGANLMEARLSGANLEFADLTGAKLTRAHLMGANLTGAYLTGANLAFASFLSANLRGAQLTGANLTDVNLRGANVTQEQLDSACITNNGPPPTLPEGLKPPQRQCVP